MQVLGRPKSQSRSTQPMRDNSDKINLVGRHMVDLCQGTVGVLALVAGRNGALQILAVVHDFASCATTLPTVNNVIGGLHPSSPLARQVR